MIEDIITIAKSVKSLYEKKVFIIGMTSLLTASQVPELLKKEFGDYLLAVLGLLYKQ
jgi:hypothetical protein